MPRPGWIAPVAVAVTVLVGAGACSRTDDVRTEATTADTWSPEEAATAVVGEPLSPRLGSKQVWTGSELLSYGGTVIDVDRTTSDLTTNMVTSINLDTLAVTRVFDPPPFSASFGGTLHWLDDRVYFAGSECRGDDDNSGRYAEHIDCPRVAVLATLDPERGEWEQLELPPGTEDGIQILGSVPEVGVLAISGYAPSRLWALTADSDWSDWTELPEPVLQGSPPGNGPPQGYVVRASCVVGDMVVQLGAERLEGTIGRDITAAVLDLGGGSETWRTSVQPELDTDSAPTILCGDDAVVFSPLTGPSGPITRFSPDDESWTSIGPSTVQPADVAQPYGMLGLPGSTGNEVVYPGAPGVGSQIVDIETGAWRAGPPAPGMFENAPTWVGTGFVGVSATGTSGELTTPAPMDLPPTGTLFVVTLE